MHLFSEGSSGAPGYVHGDQRAKQACNKEEWTCVCVATCMEFWLTCWPGDLYCRKGSTAVENIDKTSASLPSPGHGLSVDMRTHGALPVCLENYGQHEREVKQLTGIALTIPSTSATHGLSCTSAKCCTHAPYSSPTSFLTAQHAHARHSLTRSREHVYSELYLCCSICVCRLLLRVLQLTVRRVCVRRPPRHSHQ